MHCKQCHKPPCNSTYTALYYLHSIVAAYMSFKNCTDKALISLKIINRSYKKWKQSYTTFLPGWI